MPCRRISFSNVSKFGSKSSHLLFAVQEGIGLNPMACRYSIACDGENGDGQCLMGNIEQLKVC